MAIIFDRYLPLLTSMGFNNIPSDWLQLLSVRGTAPSEAFFDGRIRRLAEKSVAKEDPEAQEVKIDFLFFFMTL